MTPSSIPMTPNIIPFIPFDSQRTHSHIPHRGGHVFQVMDLFQGVHLFSGGHFFGRTFFDKCCCFKNAICVELGMTSTTFLYIFFRFLHKLHNLFHKKSTIILYSFFSIIALLQKLFTLQKHMKVIITSVVANRVIDVSLYAWFVGVTGNCAAAIFSAANKQSQCKLTA